MITARVASLHIYPVKSCRGSSVESTMLDERGFTNDRRWMVVTGSGRFLTQREVPRLALIGPMIDGDHLQLTAPGLPALAVPGISDGASIEVTLFRDRFKALDAGDEAAEWLSRFLQRSVRLVTFDSSFRRLSNRQWTGEIEASNRFSDGYPLLVISQASLDELNSRLAKPLPMNRFRPNIVLSGLQAFDEDRIHELVAGAVRLRIVKPCERCSITTTDQSAGAVDGEEPIKTLKSYRWSQELRGVLFGQNAVIASGFGEPLSVGQMLEIEWK